MGMTLEQARREARQNAKDHNITMAVGYQLNDVTGEDEFGYCPATAAGPAFVHTVLELWGTAYNDRGEIVTVSIPL